MAGAQPRDINLSPRLQFRLNLAVPEEAALYDALRALPKGKYNAAVVKLLLRGKVETRPVLDEIEERMRMVLREFAGGPGSGAAPSDRCGQAGEKDGPGIPDCCFDTSLFE